MRLIVLQLWLLVFFSLAVPGHAEKPSKDDGGILSSIKGAWDRGMKQINKVKDDLFGSKQYIRSGYPKSTSEVFRRINEFFGGLGGDSFSRVVFAGYINLVVFVVTYVSFFVYQVILHRRQMREEAEEQRRKEMNEKPDSEEINEPAEITAARSSFPVINRTEEENSPLIETARGFERRFLDEVDFESTQEDTIHSMLQRDPVSVQVDVHGEPSREIDPAVKDMSASLVSPIFQEAGVADESFSRMRRSAPNVADYDDSEWDSLPSDNSANHKDRRDQLMYCESPTKKEEKKMEWEDEECVLESTPGRRPVRFYIESNSDVSNEHERTILHEKHNVTHHPNPPANKRSADSYN